jgi:lysophospholipase L1-like esterase
MRTLVASCFFALVLTACSTKKTWVAIGDSITYLNEHKDETGNRVKKGYLTRVTEQLPEISYVNKGYNGWTAVRIAEEIESLQLTPADIYTVFLGTNDWWHGKSLGTMNDYKNKTGNQTFYGAYRTIVDKLKSLNPDARVILITPMQRGDFVYIADKKNNAHGSYQIKNGMPLGHFAQAVSAIGAHEKFDVIDLYFQSGMMAENMVKFKRLKTPDGAYADYPFPDYIGVPFNPETDEYPYPPEAIDMTYDGLHPSDKGYEVIAEMLVNVLEK